MKISLFLIFCITFIFYILGDFSFKVGQLAIPLYFIVGTAMLIVLILKNYKNFLYNINLLVKTKPGIYLALFSLWAIITIIVSIPQGTFMLGSFFTNFLGNFFCSFLFPTLIMCLLICKINDIYKIKKFIFIIYMIVFIIGIIELIGLLLNIQIVKDILSILVNRGALANNLVKDFLYANDKLRIESIFREPGEYAGFLVVSSPIIFYLGSLKEKLFHNIFVDTILKQTLKILWFVSLLMTQSPINIVFIFLVGLCWLIINRKKVIDFIIHSSKHIASAIGIMAVSIFAISALIVIGSSGNSFLSRIGATFGSIKSIDAIVEDEASLATRICTHEAQILIGLDYPVFGLGYGNMNSAWPQYVLNLPHMVTPEVQGYANSGRQMGGSSFLWKVFAETGIPGVILLYLFWFSLWKYGNKLSKRSSEGDFINALNFSLLVYVCFSWYLMLAPVFMAYYGILLGFIYKYKKLRYLLPTKED